MRRIKTYNEFSSFFPDVLQEDRSNFEMIFMAIYESHASLEEKLLVESSFGLLTEGNWFLDLVDKGKRGVLKVATKAGEVLVDIAKKAKDLLDFAKQIGSQIAAVVKEQFTSLTNVVTGSVMKDNKFVKELIDFLDKKKVVKLRTYIQDTGNLIKYVVGGKIITDLVARLSELFSSILSKGTNEGVAHMEMEYLREADEAEGEKKSFLQRLGEKIMTYKPFSWIPKIEELMKQGVSFIAKIVDRFFTWLTTGKDGPFNSFSKSFIFLFNVLELYVLYKMYPDLKKLLSEVTGLDGLREKIKGKTLGDMWNYVGKSPGEVVSNVKKKMQSIPFVAPWLTIFDTIVMLVGVYKAVEPALTKNFLKSLV